eukprot:scaffold13165_cov177-Amphora_coffeaeformis.AAC.4
MVKGGVDCVLRVWYCVYGTALVEWVERSLLVCVLEFERLLLTNSKSRPNWSRKQILIFTTIVQYLYFDLVAVEGSKEENNKKKRTGSKRRSSRPH